MPEQATDNSRNADVASPLQARSAGRAGLRKADPAAQGGPHGPAGHVAAGHVAARAVPAGGVAADGTVAGGTAESHRAHMSGPSPVGGPYVTVRGALVAMFCIFLLTCLMASWLHIAVLAGLGYAASCVLAPFLVRRHVLLHVVIAPPAIFMASVIITQVLTAQGTSRHGRALSVLEGTLLTLAGIAPWLLAGTALGVGGAMTRGLPECVRQIAAELRGDTSAVTNDARDRAAASGKS
jgi:hypothetical protein